MYLRFIKAPVMMLCAGVLGCSTTCAPVLPPADQPPPDVITFYTYQVVNEYPHDPQAFTQGLDYADGFLYESTGLHGASSVRKVDLETGKVLRITPLARTHFGEGLAVDGDRLVQLTWRSQTGFVYDRESFERIGEFSYLGEGWGLTHDGSRFIMSDGTARLRFLDMDTFAPVGAVYVRYGDTPVTRINELKYIDGLVYANIWKEDRIAIICPQSGYVVGWADMTGLLSPQQRAAVDVFNGIAYDADNDRLFVTGKYWPTLFEVVLIEKETRPYPDVTQQAP